MKEFSFARELWLPVARDALFPFFAEARNLETITPPFLRFEFLTRMPIVMRVGARIDYRIRFRGIPIRWQTEISAWEPPHRFVDEQRRGPYRLWIHEHAFEERNGGTLCVDRVQYAVWGGEWIHRWLVEPDLKRIFHFRAQRLQQLFSP